MGWVDEAGDGEDGPHLQRGSAVGRYVILGRVGAGAMGEVYAAYDPELDRKLAIKLLRTTSGPADQIEAQKVRLLREARAIAKLSHPNVVVVHDFGSIADRVFIAMEFLEGSTVTVWQHAAARSWREVVELFLAAGRGLQCAHEADLLHRDFKPENVMVSRDGQVRVMDFGLVQKLNAGPELSGQAAAPIVPLAPDATVELGKQHATALRRDLRASGTAPRAAGPLDRTMPDGADEGGGPLPGPDSAGDELGPRLERLTRTGALVGTPAYMAPEQFLGEPLDGRSDQFSFCIALHECLYGQHPFGGATITELATRVVHGAPRPPPEDSPVPSWIRRVVRKGLARAPADRYASMKELLADLARDPRTRRRNLLALAVGAVLLAGSGLAARASLGKQRAICQVPVHRFDGVWERSAAPSSHREAIRQAFLYSGEDYATAAFGAVAGLLDRYVADWAGTYQEACLATKTRGESAEVMDLRMRCLDDRFDELRALSNVLATGGGEVVENAVQSVMSLHPLERCTNTRLLRAAHTPPASSAAGAAIQVVRADLAAAKALEESGSSARARAALFEVLADARDTGYRPLIAEALYELGTVSLAEGAIEAAESSLLEAVTQAQAGHEDEILILAMIALISTRGETAHDMAGATLWHGLADASIERMGGDERLGARAQANWAAALAGDGRAEEALKSYQQALDDARRSLGPSNLQVGLILGAMARTQATLGHLEDALTASDEAMAIGEGALGRNHPRLAELLTERSDILRGLGRYQEARREAERSYALWARGVGSLDHARLATPLIAVGLAQLGAGDARRASSTLREALGLHSGGAHSPATIEARFGLARALWTMGGARAEAVALAATAREESLALARPTPRELALRKEIAAWGADPRHVVATVPGKQLAQATPSGSERPDDVTAP